MKLARLEEALEQQTTNDFIYRRQARQRRSVTPLRDLPLDSQARIQRAQLALERYSGSFTSDLQSQTCFSDYRTKYTYADTRTYTHVHPKDQYESPVLARRGIHLSPHFTPTKLKSLASKAIHLMHVGLWNYLLAPFTFLYNIFFVHSESQREEDVKHVSFSDGKRESQ